MVYAKPKDGETSFFVHWSYRSSTCTSTQATFLSLLYGALVIVHAEVIVPSARVVFASKLSDPNDGINNVTALKGRGQETSGYLIRNISVKPITMTSKPIYWWLSLKNRWAYSERYGCLEVCSQMRRTYVIRKPFIWLFPYLSAWLRA